AASGAGANALLRAENRGRAKGEEWARRQAELRSGDGPLREAFDDLRAKVEKFEAASGLELSHTYNVEDLGRLVAIVRAELGMPGWAVGAIGRAAKGARESAEEMAKRAKDLEERAQRVSAALEEATTAAAGR